MAKKTVTMRKKGRKPIRFQRGGLHKSLGVPQSEKIPASKLRAAKQGDYGEKARKQASFAMGALAKGRKTAARKRSRGGRR